MPRNPITIGFSMKRRGRDLNPRRTQRPETVFETAAFDRSATPPREPCGQTAGYPLVLKAAMRERLAAVAELASAGGEERVAEAQPRRRGRTGETWFPP